jgi:serine/threonine protein kinase
LTIFLSVCRAVALMHSQDPPIIHRDLKIENVLIKKGIYKLCDFGSATTRVYNLSVKQDKLSAEEDIQKNTTMAYRSPEMADLYSRQIINEKVDVWALGCVLYKMCYFHGPFEEAGNLQIINCKYTIPDSPRYSSKITNLIRSIFVANPENRPSVFDLIETVSQILGVDANVQKPVPRQRTEAPKPLTQKPPRPTSQNNNNNASGGLFGMIDWYDEGGQTEVPQKSSVSQSRVAPPSPPSRKDNQARIAPPSPPRRTNSNGFGFDAEEEWNADFSEFEGGTSGEKTPATAPTPSVQTRSNSSSPSPMLGGDLFSQLDWSDDAPPPVNTQKPQRPAYTHKRSHSENVQNVDTTTPKRSSNSPSYIPHKRSPLSSGSNQTLSPDKHARSGSFDMNSLVTQLPKSAPSSHVASPANVMTKSNSGADLLDLNPTKRINVDDLFNSAYQQPQYPPQHGFYQQQQPGFNTPNMSQVNFYQQYPQQYSPNQFPPQFPGNQRPQ